MTRQPPPPLVLPDDPLRWTEARVDELAGFGRTGPDHLPVAVAFHGATGEVTTLALDDPAHDLRSVHAPPGSVAVGLVALGRAHAPATPHGPVPERLGLAVLAHRQGHVASRLWVPEDGQPFPSSIPRHEGDAAHGRCIDLLRRMLGVPTPPPEVGTEAFFTTLWLTELVVRAAEVPPATLSWLEVALAHPVWSYGRTVLDLVETIDDAAPAAGGSRAGRSASEAVPPEGLEHGSTAAGSSRPTDVTDPPSLGSAHPEDHLLDALGECCEHLARIVTWERLRRSYAAAATPTLGIHPEDAAWFDTGSFARALLGGLLPGAALLERLDATLPPELARRVRAVAEPQLPSAPVAAG